LLQPKHSSKEARHPFVIRITESHDVSDRLVNAAISGGAFTCVILIDDPDPGVIDLGHDGTALIGGSIVDHQKFKVGDHLRKHGPNRSSHIVCLVVQRYYNRNIGSPSNDLLGAHNHITDGTLGSPMNDAESSLAIGILPTAGSSFALWWYPPSVPSQPVDSTSCRRPPHRQSEPRHLERKARPGIPITDAQPRTQEGLVEEMGSR
jgi:hypothetical protein